MLIDHNTRRPSSQLRALQSHASISSHPPSPQRPGGPGTTSLGKLGLSVYRHGRSAAAISISFLQEKSLWRDDRGKVKVLEQHRVEIKLGASYPRSMPEIRWLTPIFHPNISEIGMVCLGGYGTHWVPSVQLDDLCVMLWDMARYHNYDIRSPYNRESALWVAGQTTFRFPIDDRPLRDDKPRSGASRRTANRYRDAESPRRDEKNALWFGFAANRSNSTTPVARVLHFIERYGRVFGSAGESEASRGNGTADACSAP